MNRLWRTVAEPIAVPRLPGEPRIERLANGLTVCLVHNPQAPIVTSALFYRVGTRDEPAGHGGVAHFLEHMMFKGSSLYGPGEIDRRTQALGGVNNAFTSHDATGYYFNFASDRWAEALRIEADRMSGLTLDPEQVASERQVILEEIAMYDSEPWEALETEVQARLFPGHPYGRPVLGTREELLATGGEELAGFHRRFYRPDNAVLVVAGDLRGSAGSAQDDALAQVERALGGLPAGAAPRLEVTPPAPLSGLERVERRKGEVARLMISVPVPPGDHRDHPALKLMVTLLAGGRASLLHRALVDEGQLCSWVSADVSSSLDASQITVAAEVVPDIEPARVEEKLLALLAKAVAEPPSAEEMERAKQIATADWVFGHEKVHQQALAAGLALTLFHLGHLEEHLRDLLDTGTDRLLDVASRYLRPERGGVLGWSLPRVEP
jgi:zinc protease